MLKELRTFDKYEFVPVLLLTTESGSGKKMKEKQLEQPDRWLKLLIRIH